MKNLRIQITTVFLAIISFLLMIFPKIAIIPGADFLQLELSAVILLYVQYLFGAKQALIALFYRSALHLIFLNAGLQTLIGLPINIIGVLVLIFSYHLFDKKNNWIKVVVSTIFLTITMLIVNYFIAIPMYAKFMNFDISKTIGVFKYLFLMVAPFNLIEGVVTGVFYILLRKTLRKSAVIDLINR